MSYNIKMERAHENKTRATTYQLFLPHEVMQCSRRERKIKVNSYLNIYK